MGLREYHRKRDFARTSEPRGGVARRRRGRAAGLGYVIQKHDARRLHHDFRLELDGVLLSWAVPKGPPSKPGERVLAVRTEDHPIEYGEFEGVIPEGQYGGGTVMLWDRGTWQPLGDPVRALGAGKLDFVLDGERLKGRWSLVRMRGSAEDRGKENWLLIKRSDETPARLVAGSLDRSVATGRSMAEIGRAGDRVWDARTGAAKRRARSKSQSSSRPNSQSKSRSKTQSKSSPKLPPKPRRPRVAARSEIAGAMAELPGARRAAMPRSLAPQLATLVAATPDGDEWVHEVKFDGYRLLAFADGAEVRLRTRTGQDWTRRFPPVAQAIAGLDLRAVLDGEVVVLRADGLTDFQALQNWLEDGAGEARGQLAYFAFDLPWCDGFDLTGCELLERKRVLARLLEPPGASSLLRYSEHVAGHGAAFFAKACELGLEGTISKRARSTYETRRTKSWVKTKCLAEQEFVVGGWTRPQGSRHHFGALLLGVYEDGVLRYAGKVGTGFSEASLARIHGALARLETHEPPFADPPRGAAGRHARWVRPEVVVEVAFTGWTADGRLRHPTCRGLREDKDPKSIRRERAAPVAALDGAPVEQRAAPVAARRQRSAAKAARPRRSADAAVTVAGVRITNPDRVLWPEAGLTKADLARYYEAVAEHVLPHVAGRPLTLVRCPQGRASGCFYQKHVAQTLPPPVRAWRVEEKQGSGDYVGIDDLAGLLTLVQFGALELHPWGSGGAALERPDRIVIDLDPGPGVAWADVVAAARDLRERLRGLGLASFARTTGGKGLHVVVPLEPPSTWPAVKEFAHALVTSMAREDPAAFVTTASKAQRHGRIFLDWLRNARGATAVASYSPRARPGAPVAMPVAWSRVGARLDPAAFTVATVPRLLARRGDAWPGFFDVRQTLPDAPSASAKRSRRR